MTNWLYSRISRTILKRFLKRSKGTTLSMREAVACDLVKTWWRNANSNIVELWKGLEAAALEAVATGRAMQYGAIKFGVRGDFLHMRLPSGRLLAYPFPQVDSVETDWGTKQVVSAMTVDSVTRKWVRRSYYGGLWAENLTQAVARDCMAEAMLELQEKFDITMTVHDELVAEGNDLEAFKAIMSRVPAWAPGLPVDVDAWEGKRYRK